MRLSKSKADLYAAIRRDHRAGMSMRALERKYRATWQTVRKALDLVWPEPRRKLPPRPTRLDPYMPVIDGMLRKDLDAQPKQRHTAKRVFERLLDEYAATEISYQLVPRLRCDASWGDPPGKRGGGRRRCPCHHHMTDNNVRPAPASGGPPPTRARRMRAFVEEEAQIPDAPGRLCSDVVMEPIWTSVVAVAGTLLGAVVTYPFQRLAAKQQRLRDERIAAYTSFATAVEDFRHGQAERFFRKQEDPDGEAYQRAYHEGHRLRKVACQAFYRVKLVTEDDTLVARAPGGSELYARHIDGRGHGSTEPTEQDGQGGHRGLRRLRVEACPVTETGTPLRRPIRPGRMSIEAPTCAETPLALLCAA
ncbi:hypothetical protein [Streptomyces sp. HD]|uniref:hypothetical protein n=1 Tax=Streptomyces sp. HD TaxID=3020892 RepID=UPI002FEE5F13